MPVWEILVIVAAGLCLLFWVVLPLVELVFTYLCWKLVFMFLWVTGALDSATEWLREHTNKVDL